MIHSDTDFHIDIGAWYEDQMEHVYVQVLDVNRTDNTVHVMREEGAYECLPMCECTFLSFYCKLRGWKKVKFIVQRWLD